MIRTSPAGRALIAAACALALLLTPLVARAGWSSAELVAASEAADADPGTVALARHRAALLDPGAVDAPTHPAVASPLPPHQLAWAFNIGVALGLGGIAWLAVSGRRRSALAIGALGLTIATAAAIPLSRLAEARDLAIVMEDAALLPSPASSAPELATLEAGDAVRLGEEHGEFVEVSGTHGTGWVHRTALTRVVPIDA